MDKVTQLLNEVGKQLGDQGFITKIFIPPEAIKNPEVPDGYYKKIGPDEYKHYTVEEVENIRNKDKYNENVIIIVINGV